MNELTRDALSGFSQHQQNILILVTVFRNGVTEINLYCNLALLMSFKSGAVSSQHLKNTTKHLLHYRYEVCCWLNMYTEVYNSALHSQLGSKKANSDSDMNFTDQLSTWNHGSLTNKYQPLLSPFSPAAYG